MAERRVGNYSRQYVRRHIALFHVPLERPVFAALLMHVSCLPQLLGVTEAANRPRAPALQACHMQPLCDACQM